MCVKMLDLMHDAIIPVEDAGNQTVTTLPGVLAKLCRDEVGGFPGLAAHQAQAWYHLLAQLGALALRPRGLDTPPRDPSVWRDLILRLSTESAESAWSLVVPDTTRPAFLQPPTNKLDKFKPPIETPDALDVLVTAKNHDRKQARAVAAEPHHWLYALVTLQTVQGFSGRGNPGIARMNGGFSSRVLVDRRPSARWGQRVVRAIRMLLARRAEVLRAVPTIFRAEGGLALTWLRDWDTDGQLTMSELDPYFVEVCRRVRLTGTVAGQIAARVRPAVRNRVNAKHLKGSVGDPWVPVRRSDGAALTVGAGGFNYRLVQRILFSSSEFSRPLALERLRTELSGDSEIHMAALVRGQGKTEGLHVRVIPLPRTSAAAFDPSTEAGDRSLPLEEMSKAMVGLAAEARKVLRRATLVYLQGPDGTDFQRPDASSVLAAYERDVDNRFFGFLFRAPSAGMDAIDEEWQKFLLETVKRLARELVWGRMTPPASRREKARAASTGVLFSGLRKHLPRAFPATDDDDKEISR